MELKFHVDVVEPQATFAIMADAAQNPSRILRRWGGYMRSQSKRSADEQEGWPGWAESTRRKYEQTRTSKVTTVGEVRASYAKNLAKSLRSKARQGVVSAPGDLVELARLRAGGAARKDYAGGKALGALNRALDRSRTTGRRVGGDRRVVARKKLLGRLPRMQDQKIAGTTVTLTNRVPWSGVQNEGGSAGHGAKIPARTWLEIDDHDRVVLAQIALDSLMGGPRR